MSKFTPTVTSFLILLLGSILLHTALGSNIQFTERPKIQFGKPFDIDDFVSNSVTLKSGTVAEAGFIKQQNSATKQNKKDSGQINFNTIIAEIKKADTDFKWRGDVGKKSKVQFYVKDSSDNFNYARIEFIQPQESDEDLKCMKFDINVSYKKDDSKLSGGDKSFKESKIIKPGQDKSSPDAKKAIEISNLSKKQTLTIQKKSKDDQCSGQDGLTIEKIQISPESLKATENIFNGKEKLPPTECQNADITCTGDDPSQCTDQDDCEKIKDDDEQDAIVCHQSTGTGLAKTYTGCKVKQKGDGSKPSFQKKTTHPRFTKMGKDMAAGNVPSGGAQNKDFELKTADFNYDQFDQNGCLKLIASVWLSGNKFVKTEIQQCIDPCRLAKKLYSDLSKDEKPFKQKGGFDANKKVDTNANTQDAKIKWESNVKTPSFVQKSMFMEIENKSNKVDEKVTFIDQKGKDQNGKGGKERKINERGLKDNKIEIKMKDLIQSSGYDNEEQSSLSLKCQNLDGTIEQVGPKQKLPDFKVPDEHSCMKLKLPKFKTLDGKQLKQYIPQNSKEGDPKAFQMPKQPLNLQLQLDDSDCSNGEKAEQYKIIDIELRTFDDLEKDKEFFNKVEFVRMGCSADLCQVLDAGEDEFLEIPAKDCVDDDSNYAGKKVCTYKDPVTFKTKKFVQSVGQGDSIDYSEWTKCQGASSGDCQSEAECKKGTRSTKINFDSDCANYKKAIEDIRGSAKENPSKFSRVPGVDYNDKLLSVSKVQRKPEKKLQNISEEDLDAGKIPAPTVTKDGSLQLPQGGFKKQKARVEKGEKAPTKPTKAGEIPDVDQQLNTEWRINPFEVKDGKVNKNKDLVPREGRSVFVFVIIQKLDSASPSKTVIKLVKQQIKLFNKQIKDYEKPKIQFESSNVIELGKSMKLKAKILGGVPGEKYTLKFQKIDEQTNEKDGEVFQVGAGKKIDVDVSPGEVSKMFGYRRENIELSFEVYDSDGILVYDDRIEIKTKLPEKTSQQLECVTLDEFACFKGSYISQIADRDPKNVPIVTDSTDLSCTPVISTQNCQEGIFSNLEVTQVIARTNRDIKEEYWKKGLDQAPDKECKERPLICTSDIEVIQENSETKGQVKEVKCRDIYNSKELQEVTSRKDSKGKVFYRAQARQDEKDDEQKYIQTERVERVVDKQKSQKRPSCYILNPEKPNILSPDSPCAKLADPALGQEQTEKNCPLSKKCYDLLVSQDQDIRDDADCRKTLQDWADSFQKDLSFQQEYQSQNMLNDKLEQAFDDELPYFVTIKGEWFPEKNRYFDFFLKVVLNDGGKVYVLDSPARIYVANQTPPSQDEWVDLKVKPAPQIIEWNDSFTYTPSDLVNISDETDLDSTQGYRVILQRPNSQGDGFEDVSASDLGSQIQITFSELFKVYQFSRQENNFGEKQLIEFDTEQDDQATDFEIPQDLSEYKKKLYREKIAQENFNPEKKYGQKQDSFRYFRLLLEYPSGFTLPTPIKVTIKPPSAQTNKPGGCSFNPSISVKYDNTDLQRKTVPGNKIYLSSQRSSAFEIGADLSGCSAWTGYSIYGVQIRDYEDLTIENGFRGAADKGAGQCIVAPIGCGDVRGKGRECFDLESNKVQQRTVVDQKVYDNEYKECYIKDEENKHPIERPENVACISTGRNCKFDKKCFFDKAYFKSAKCLQYKKRITFLSQNKKSPNDQKGKPQKSENEKKVESKLNQKLGHAKLQKVGGKNILFVEKFGDDVKAAGLKSLTFHIALIKQNTAQVIYIKKTVEFNVWKPAGVPNLQMKNQSGDTQTGKIFRDWGSDCVFQIKPKNQDPTMTLRVQPRIQRNQKSEDKFDNGEDNLTNLVSGATLNKKQCFQIFGVAAQKSGAKVKVDVFSGIDKVGEKGFDIVLRAPGVGDIKTQCKPNANQPTIEIYEDDISTGNAVRGSKLDKNLSSQYELSLKKDNNIVIKVVKDSSCSDKPDFKIILSFAEDLSKEQCLYNDPSCKELGDCKKIKSIPCNAEGCTIQGQKGRIASENENDKSDTSIKRVNGKFDCYVEVPDGSSFNGKKALPDKRPKFDIPLQDGPNPGELQIAAESVQFLKRVLSGEITVYAHVFQFDKGNDADNDVDYYQTQPIQFKFQKPGLQIKQIEGYDKKDKKHPKNKDFFLRLSCQNPGAEQDGEQTTITKKYKCPEGIDQSFCDDFEGKNLTIPKSVFAKISVQKKFEVICQEIDKDGNKKEAKQEISITFEDVPDCPKLQLFPEQMEISEEKIKRFEKLGKLLQLKIIIDKTGCSGQTLNKIEFKGAGIPKPQDVNVLGSEDKQIITQKFTKKDLQKIKHKSKHNIDVTLTFDTSRQIKSRFTLFRAAAQLKGRAKGANRVIYKGEAFSFDVQISDAALEAGEGEDYETEAFCPQWIDQEICDQIPGKNFQIDQRLMSLVPEEQLGKPQRFEFRIYSRDGRQISIPATITVLDSNLKSKNLPQIVIKRDDQDSKYAKYGEVFFYAAALNSETGLEEEIDLDDWDLSWRFLQSSDDKEIKDLDKFQFGDTFTVDLQDVRKAGSKGYKAQLTLTNTKENISFKTSLEVKTSPPPKQGRVSFQQKSQAGKTKRHSFNFQEYENIQYYEIRCVKKGKDKDDVSEITKKFVTEDGSFQDISLPNSDDNECYNIAKDSYGFVQSQKIQYNKPKKNFKGKSQALALIQNDFDSLDQLLSNQFFEEASDDDKGEMFMKMSQKLDADFKDLAKQVNGLISKSKTGGSINKLKSFMKGLDLKQGLANKSDIESQTLSTFELVADSAINAIDTLTDSDLQNIFEVIFEMEEELSMSQATRSSAKTRKHEMIRRKLANSRQGQVQKIQTATSKMMYSQFTTSNVKSTMEFQASAQDPKVKIQPGTIDQIGKDASLKKVNCVATSSNKIPTEIETDATGKKLQFPFKKTQNMEITSQDGKEISVDNLPTGKEVKIEFPSKQFEANKKCKGNFVDESTGKLDQKGVTCQYDAATNVPTIKSAHLTTFTITTDTVQETVTPTPTPTPPPTTESSSGSDSLSAGALAGIIVGSLVVVIGLTILIIYLVKRGKVKTRKNQILSETPQKNSDESTTHHHMPTEQKLDNTDNSEIIDIV